MRKRILAVITGYTLLIVASILFIFLYGVFMKLLGVMPDLYDWEVYKIMLLIEHTLLLIGAFIVSVVHIYFWVADKFDFYE